MLSRIRGIKLLILDVDGVMTDGRIIIDDAGLESKQFDVKDGHGLKMLMKSGIDVVLLTGRKSRVVDHRAVDLGIAEVHQGIWNKREVFDEILKRRKLSPEETAYVGDDVVDIPLLKRVGFGVAVVDACPEATGVADYVTEHSGGRGAVREVCEVILKVQGRWEELAARYEFA
ncbi:MAG: phenylphosphate carboxylase subunit delta [Syntrophus sp. (in: bacteria)]|nr:phenylphosphate carboxylase subunit delta [Syntrophus sp. (in: bacteria)]